ncbi:unnamed protein product [Phytophthora lilii]|uniref:Unnamed protein product n=1 Tax=Phytophthora lilii TaxID=2077276 RepID=A0A9W6X8X9_9STRA|nr:unnamed protein product [Phytophthora lilii]
MSSTSSKSLDHYVVSAEALERDKEDKSLDSQELVLRVGRLLHATIIAKDVSPACLAAIERMAQLGGFSGDNVQELSRAAKTMAACIAATTTSEPIEELMTLWSVVHEAISDGFVEKAKLLFENIAANTREVHNAQSIGKLLETALYSSRDLAAVVSQGLQDGLHLLADAGAPLAKSMMKELSSHLLAIHDALSDQDWGDLCSRCSDATGVQWQTLSESAAKERESR